MKKILLAGFLLIALSVPAFVFGQAFVMDSLTAHYTTTGALTGIDNVNDTGSTAITLHWRVIATDFPHAWLAGTAFGICDNQTCYYNAPDPAGHSMPLWNDTTGTGQTYTSLPYAAGSHGNFDLSLSLGSASIGCHYVMVALTDPLVQTDTVTFYVCKVATNETPIVVKSPDDVVLYPNPARDEVNIVYDAASDIKNILVYNIIGKVMAIYKVTDNSSANLNLENIPSGIYFVRLLNSHGMMVATRKFTKQ